MRKSIWTILVMAWGLAAGAQTTLMIPLGQTTGSDQLRAITITPLDGVTTYQGMLYNSGPITVQPTAGGATNVFGDLVPGATTNLAVGGNLRLTWQGLSKAAQIYAPYGAAFVNAADPVVQRGGIVQVWTWTNGVTLAAGTNVSLATNNGVVTIAVNNLTPGSLAAGAVDSTNLNAGVTTTIGNLASSIVGGALAANQNYHGTFAGNLAGGTNMAGTNGLLPFTANVTNLDNTAFLDHLVSSFPQTTNWGRFGASNTLYCIKNRLPVNVLICGNGWCCEANGSVFDEEIINLTNALGTRGFYSLPYSMYGGLGQQMYENLALTSFNINTPGGPYIAGPTTNWFPNHLYLPGNGASFSVAPNQIYTTYPFNVFEVDYIASPNGTSFTVSTNSGSGSGTVATLTGFSSTQKGMTYRWTNGAAVSGMQITIANTGAGTNYFVTFGYINTNMASGVVFVNQSRQSTSPTDWAGVSNSVAAPIYSSWNPALILDIFSCQNNDAYYATRTDFYKTNLPNADVVLCNQLQVTPGLADGQALKYQCALTNGFMFFDGYQAGDYYSLDARGLMIDDGNFGHLSTRGYKFFGDYLWSWLGLMDRRGGGLVNLPSAAANGNGIISSNQFVDAFQAPPPTMFQAAAAVPPRIFGSGYNNTLTEANLKADIDGMVTNGFKQAGWGWYLIDDCWAKRNATTHNLDFDPARFPSGGRALVDYAHQRGVKVVLYASLGPGTQAGLDGSWGYFAQDAWYYATNYNVDGVKYEPYPYSGDTNAAIWNEQMFTSYLVQASKRPLFIWSSEPTLRAPFDNTQSYYDLWKTRWESAWYSGPAGAPDTIDAFGGTYLKFAAGLAGAASIAPGHYVAGVGWFYSVSDSTLKGKFESACILPSPLEGFWNSAPSTFQAQAQTNLYIEAIHEDPAVLPPNIVGQSIVGTVTNYIFSRPLGSPTGTEKAVWFPIQNTNQAVSLTLYSTNLTSTATNSVMSFFNPWTGAYEAWATNSYTFSSSTGPTSQLYRVTCGFKAPPFVYGTNWASDQNWVSATNGPANAPNGVLKDQTQQALNNPIVLNGITYPKGISMCATSAVCYALGGVVSNFTGAFGVEDSVAGGASSVQLYVYGDGALLWNSQSITNANQATNFNIGVSGKMFLTVLMKGMNTGGSAALVRGDIGGAAFVIPQNGVFVGNGAGLTLSSLHEIPITVGVDTTGTPTFDELSTPFNLTHSLCGLRIPSASTFTPLMGYPLNRDWITGTTVDVIAEVVTHNAGTVLTYASGAAYVTDAGANNSSINNALTVTLTSADTPYWVTNSVTIGTPPEDVWVRWGGGSSTTANTCWLMKLLVNVH